MSNALDVTRNYYHALFLFNHKPLLLQIISIECIVTMRPSWIFTSYIQLQNLYEALSYTKTSLPARHQGSRLEPLLLPAGRKNKITMFDTNRYFVIKWGQFHALTFIIAIAPPSGGEYNTLHLDKGKCIIFHSKSFKVPLLSVIIPFLFGLCIR